MILKVLLVLGGVGNFDQLFPSRLSFAITRSCRVCSTDFANVTGSVIIAKYGIGGKMSTAFSRSVHRGLLCSGAIESAQVEIQTEGAAGSDGVDFRRGPS